MLAALMQAQGKGKFQKRKPFVYQGQSVCGQMCMRDRTL